MGKKRVIVYVLSIIITLSFYENIRNNYDNIITYQNEIAVVTMSLIVLCFIIAVVNMRKEIDRLRTCNYKLAEKNWALKDGKDYAKMKLRYIKRNIRKIINNEYIHKGLIESDLNKCLKGKKVKKQKHETTT